MQNAGAVEAVAGNEAAWRASQLREQARLAVKEDKELPAAIVKETASVAVAEEEEEEEEKAEEEEEAEEEEAEEEELHEHPLELRSGEERLCNECGVSDPTSIFRSCAPCDYDV